MRLERSPVLVRRHAENSQRGIEINLAIGISGDDLAQPRRRLAMPTPRPSDRVDGGTICGVAADQPCCNAAQMFELDKLGPIDCDITRIVGFGLDAGRFGQSPVQMNSIMRLSARISPYPARTNDRGGAAE